MPHVDDGILHAWLDGAIDALAAAGELPAEMTKADVAAHLSSCPDCRARLEVEREVRERAGLVLHDASLPSVPVPPFSEIAAEGRARRAPRRVLPLSWAASVLLAVGAGWWGSAQWRSQMPDSLATREEAAMSAPAAPAAGDGAASMVPEASTAPPAAYLPDALDAEVVADRPVSSPAPRTAAAPPPSEQAVSRAGEIAAAQPTAATEARADAAPPAADARAAASEDPRAAPASADAQPPRALASVDTTILGEVVPMSRRSGLDQTASSVAAQAAAARNEMQRAQPLASTALVPSDSSGTIYLVPNAEMRAFEGLLLRARTGQLRWRAVAPEQSADIADQLFVIEGASQPTVERATDRETTSVRITQQLETGTPVELLVWRQDAVAMSEVAVTAASTDPARERGLASSARRAPAAAPPAVQEAVANKATAGAIVRAPLVTTGASQLLPDGRRELVLRSSATPVWIALRANLSDVQIRDLARRIVVLDDRR